MYFCQWKYDLLIWVITYLDAYRWSSLTWNGSESQLATWTFWIKLFCKCVWLSSLGYLLLCSSVRKELKKRHFKLSGLGLLSPYYKYYERGGILLKALNIHNIVFTSLALPINEIMLYPHFISWVIVYTYVLVNVPMTVLQCLYTASCSMVFVWEN
jgi:hypothetical protein